ncbi:ABC transporter permease [Catalinimonas niigatensis]|uniref:ABC transporter permease n=1 Tax=Catalinimonas niigatensis TaxID=1397264 RepID=UPI002664F713|nr:ABC transporter permease [Catalinimonas niigatensis]WPP51349.1 ABC transporter permease [Catalinimonas niigatensis]
MLKNYLIIAYRNLLKNKVFSLINILGLAIGMAACLLVLQYVNFELSYDNFHDKSKRMYRAALYQYKEGTLDVKSALTFPTIGRELQENFPETVASFVRMHHQSGVFSRTDTDQAEYFDEERVYYVDNSFFEVFSFPLLMGNVKQALTNPNAVVITRSAAEKYFGEDWREVNPIGKTLRERSRSGGTDLSITGVADNPPGNSHLKFDFLISYTTMYAWQSVGADYRYDTEESWYWDEVYTYLVLKAGQDPQQLEEAFAPIVNQRTRTRDEQGFTFRTVLQPLKEIHLHSALMDEMEVGGNIRTVYILFIVAVCILIIAWVNFVNLSVIKAIERGKEMGLRKVLGAKRIQLVKQHLLESALLNGLGILVAFTLFQLSLPYFEHFVGITMDHTSLTQGIGIVVTGVLLVAGTILSSLYPAAVLSAFHPARVLRGKLTHSRQGSQLRQGLVVFQFAAATVFIIIVFVVSQQLSFMRNYELGVNIDQKLVIEAPMFANSVEEARANALAYKTALKRHSSVQHATLSRNVPATEIRGNNYVRQLGKPEEAKFYHVMGVDYDYMATFGLQLVAGRFFDEAQPLSNAKIVQNNENAPDFGTNDHSVMVNETAINKLGFSSAEEAIDQQIFVFGGVKQIVGVVKDYHHKSLKSSFEPIIFYLQPSDWEFITLDITLADGSSVQVDEIITYAKQQWEQIYPDEPFHYFFLDDLFNQQYQADQRFHLLFNLFSGLIIFISCMGLFGLSSYSTIQKTKEIGVRKVLGASVQSIVALLSREFIRLVLLSSILALPFAYWAAQHWLKNYALRIDVSWWLLLSPIAIVLFIALLTISFQTIKAALANPVDALKYE